ncbi:MAG: ribosomal protein S18 acetylase RimI-like enzyme [Paraglaciecola sp.]|jgi:ribosomal protein S18 acetylase RimI-like enzyme
MHHTIPELVFSDDSASCWPIIREIWCETNADFLGLEYEGPIVDLMLLQFSAKMAQYQTQYPNLQQRIAYFQKKASGYIMWSLENDELVVVDIAVLTAYQRKGIATELLQQCIKTANQNKKPVRLTVTRDNPAISLYLRMGFTIVSSNHVHHQMQRDLPKVG